MIFRLDPNTDKARNAQRNDVIEYYNLKLTYVLVHSFQLFIYKSENLGDPQKAYEPEA